jgi:hypothetical protein
MSYEGYIQALCENGHYNQFQDRMDVDPEAEVCHICKSKIVWTNSVDDTNGDHWGLIPPDLFNAFLKSPSKVETCNLGHSHVIFHEVYDIPTEEERVALRSYKGRFDWKFCKPEKRELQKQLKERAARAPK